MLPELIRRHAGLGRKQLEPRWLATLAHRHISDAARSRRSRITAFSSAA
jgi:hypothetical protein